MDFNGKLTEEQLFYLQYFLKDKDITKIQKYLEKYKNHLTNYKDLVGDNLIPGDMFFMNMKLFGYLFQDEPEKVLSKAGVEFRKYFTHPLINKLGPLFLHSPMVSENRNELLGKVDNNGNYIKDEGIKLPKEPVIWAPNHHFKDDVLASVLAAKRPHYILFGSVPQFYNTFDGVLAYLIGSLMTNRKVGSSRKASVKKANKAFEYGADILMFPEGVWDKYPHHLLLKFWPGIYHVANETGAKVVPMVHYIYDPTQQLPKKQNPIHTVIDEPIDLTQFSEKAGLEYLRDVMATWYYLMMEKYGQSTREELLNGCANSQEAWEKHMEGMMDTVDRYDTSIEYTAHFRPRDIITPVDAFGDIANLVITSENKEHVEYARKLVKECKKNDFQSRF